MSIIKKKNNNSTESNSFFWKYRFYFKYYW